MTNQIQNFLNYLLDSETTSERSFIETIEKPNELFQSRYLKDWEHTVLCILQQVLRNNIITSLNNEDNNSQKSESASSEDESSSTSEDEEEEEESNNQNLQSTSVHNKTITTNKYIDAVRQCQRLLRLLHYCQQKQSDFSQLYFRTLEQCLKSDNEKLIIIVLQQIASHLFEGTNNDNEYQRLIKNIPTNIPSFRILPSYQHILKTIQTFLNTNKTEFNIINFLSNHLDILYPYTTRYLDVRREFRDTAHYIIDGDSLLLSTIHHINLNLNSYCGNTLHVIFIIERILFALLQQSQQLNYTVVFFDCHYHLYQQENSILSLLRACLIAHLSKNLANIQQFPSWLDEKYLKFTRNEKPMFLLYHNMSSLNFENNPFLSQDTLEKLHCVYHLFGNYHQYTIQCHLYLMNKLTLNETTVKCFQIQFHRVCAKKLHDEIMSIIPSNSIDFDQERNWNDYKSLCQNIADNDIRLFLYLQTIVQFIEERNPQIPIQLYSPLLILHIALLIRLSISDRHLPSTFPSVTFSSNLTQFIARFQQHLALNITSSTSSLSYSKIADLFDGRFFAFTLYQISQSNIRLDSKTDDIVKQSLKLLNISSNENLFQDIIEDLIESKEISFSSSTTEHQIPSTKSKQKIIKISNPFINAYLDPILSSKDSLTCELIKPNEDHIFDHNNKHIWNTYKDVGDEMSRIHDSSAEKPKNDNPRYRTKTQQKLYDYFTLYGRSLATHDARDNQLQIVLPTASTPVPANKENLSDQAESSATTSGGKKKQQHKNQPKKVQPTKKDQIIEQNKQRILDKRTDDESEKLKNVEICLKQIAADNYLGAIDFLEESLVNFKTTEKRLELLKRKFECQRKYLRSLKKKNQLSSEEKSKFELLQISFFATMCEMTHLENILDAFNENKKYMEELVDDSALDREKWYRFQMEKINSRLPRREQGMPDIRADFIPDEWQVKFLNAVDKQQSIIIVAPTASGKTYASYYAMGKVLKDKDDTNGICIYVAPTKALINQVAGTIHMKFGPVFGIFTMDYRMCLDTCRILVTVPECLEMLLLSSSYQRWCQRIRYCIFDEIHCMSGDIGSDFWERTMLLINCPMIGLSATVNNGQHLEEWIRKIEQQRSKLFQTEPAREVCLISHHERLADLNKYLYSNRQLHPLHSISLMNAKQLTTRGIPDDFSLSPCETLRLNDAMQQIQGHTPQIPTLTEHFSPGWIAERSVCNTYSKIVCDQLKYLIQNKQNTTIDSISTALSPGQVSYPELKPMSALIGEFVMTLKEKNLLPCIIFTDSRALCEELAESVTQYLEEIENELRRTKYRREIEEIEKRLSFLEKAQKSAKTKKTVKSATKRKSDEEDNNEKPDDIRKMEEEDQSYLRLSGREEELMNGILEEGTLSNRRHCDRELVDRLIERASKANRKLVRYLKRGIAYHHAELNNRGRLAVEGLFRNRHVQIVFSTWTLALGVHMPTKTVAFIKDSIELDALQYRQSSGRAGRRGFDVQGNVIFIDIPLSKIRHLTISAIPNIQTHLPTSVTFLMRLLHFYSQAEDKKDAINRSLVTLQNPFNAQTSKIANFIDLQLRYHCLYTLDFLYRLNFLDQQGNLIGLAGFLTHLHQCEPANILFAYLLDTQSFKNINDEEQVVNLLAHLFTNMPWSVTHQSLPTQNTMFNSKFSLQPISSEIHQHIDRYNSLVKQIYGSYIENLIQKIRSFNLNQEQFLPFSNISFHQPSDYDNGSYEYHLHHHYSQQSQNPSISPFAGPSGLTHEQFMSNYQPSTNSWDLATNLDLSSRMIPFVDIDVHDHTNATYYLNSYALDFFKHGSERFLVTENGLEWGETYSLLQDFLHSLTSIKTSFNTILESEVKQQMTTVKFFRPLTKLFSSIESEFSDKFHKQFK